MAVGVYLTFKVLDLADLTVDGSFGTGGAVLVVCTIAGTVSYTHLMRMPRIATGSTLPRN